MGLAPWGSLSLGSEAKCEENEDNVVCREPQITRALESIYRHASIIMKSCLLSITFVIRFDL